MYLRTTPDADSLTENAAYRRLPSKFRLMVLCPFRGAGFQLSHKIGKSRKRLKADEQMYMIGHSVYLDGFTAMVPHNAAEIFVELRFPRFVDDRKTIPCSVNKVVEKVCI